LSTKSIYVNALILGQSDSVYHSTLLFTVEIQSFLVPPQKCQWKLWILFTVPLMIAV